MTFTVVDIQPEKQWGIKHEHIPLRGAFNFWLDLYRRGWDMTGMLEKLA